jgi:hypothetical protein
MQPAMFHPTPSHLTVPRGIRKTRLGFFASIIAGVFAASNLPAQVAINKAQTTAASSQSAAPITLNATETDSTVKKPSTMTSTETNTPTAVEPTIVVQGDELPSAYGAPGSFSRSRFSTLTAAYVLPPGGIFAGLIYEGDIDEHGPTDSHFTQEIEVGLPYRFGLAIENEIQNFNNQTVNGSFSIEGRWALADWGKIPLNPTLFAEYKIGTDRILHEEGPEEEMVDEEDITPEEEEEMMREEERMMRQHRPNAYEFRLLLSEEIAKNVEWAFNAFLENETTGDRGREWGFAQSIQVPVLLPHERLKLGLEMQYKNFTVKDTRGDPLNSFVIGPSVAFKPTARMRFDVAPLVGVTNDSPDLQVFAIFSYVFGGGSESGGEAPASTRNR